MRFAGNKGNAMAMLTTVNMPQGIGDKHRPDGFGPRDGGIMEVGYDALSRE